MMTRAITTVIGGLSGALAGLIGEEFFIATLAGAATGCAVGFVVSLVPKSFDVLRIAAGSFSPAGLAAGVVGALVAKAGLAGAIVAAGVGCVIGVILSAALLRAYFKQMW